MASLVDWEANQTVFETNLRILQKNTTGQYLKGGVKEVNSNFANH